jgi:hypothetical protein
MNYWFLLSLSFLVIVASCLPIRGRLRASIYSADVVALIGFLCMIVWNPPVFFQLYGSTTQEIVYRVVSVFGTVSRETVVRYVNIYVCYVVFVLMHVFPLYVLRSQRSFGNPLLFLVVYGVVFSPWIHDIYGMTIAEMCTIVAIAYLGWIGVMYVREGETTTRAVVKQIIPF